MINIIRIITLLYLIILLPFFSKGQNSGIYFEDSLSWNEVITKAQLENKFIFVDCYTTWCTPCRKMDKEIYSKGEVGEFINKKFISIKLQMDSSKLDNSIIMSRYQTAHDFFEKYSIYSYPTFLFFSPEGKLLHRGLGFKQVQQFVLLSKAALDPKKQYYTLLEKYKVGKLDISDMLYLMNTAKSLNDKIVVKQIGIDYIDNYLSKLDRKKLLTSVNIQLLWQFTQSSKEKGFKIFKENSTIIDSIMGKGYCKNFFDKIIYNEDIGPIIEIAKRDGTNPDWGSLSKTITEKYGKDYAGRTISRSKVNWYKWSKDWDNYTKWIIISIQKYASADELRNSWYINNEAWEVFKFSNKKNELISVYKWLRNIILDNNKQENNDANIIDTYANVLYKLGKLSDAIKWEEKAAKMDSSDKEIKEALNKMRKGEPTWCVPASDATK